MSNEMNVQETTLNQVLIFSVDCNIWSARKKLKPEDLPGITDLPPAQVMSLGSKRICDPDKIAVFDKLKRRAIRACEMVGSRFLGGYAVPKAKARDLALELKAVEAEFQEVRKDFLDGYTAAVDDWIAANQKWEVALRKAITPKDVVERRIGFSFSVTKVAAADEDDELLNAGLMNELGSLSGQLFFEVARDARELLEKSIVPRQGSITQRAVSSLRKLQQKLEGFMFLDGRIGRVATHFNEVLSRMPKAGHVEGRDFTELFGLVVILSDQAKLKKFADGFAALQGSGILIEAEAEAEVVIDVPAESVVETNSLVAAVEAVEPAMVQASLDVDSVSAPELDFSDFDDLADAIFDGAGSDVGEEEEAAAGEEVEAVPTSVEDSADDENDDLPFMPMVAKPEVMAPTLHGETLFF